MEVILAAKALIIVGDDALILRNSDTHPRWPLMGDLPGGTIEHGETIEDGLIREVLEECGIELKPFDAQEMYAVTHSNDEVMVVYHFFVARLDSKPEIVMDFEHDEFKWVPIADIEGVESPYQEGIDHCRQAGLL